MTETKEPGTGTTAEEMAEKARLIREKSNREKRNEERAGNSGTGPIGPGNAGQKKNGENGEALADAAKQAIFINLGTEGTVMITKPGEYKGIYQPPKFMISKAGMSKLDRNNIIKSQWFSFSMLTAIRLFNALKINAEYVNKYANEEREDIMSLKME